MLGWTLEDLIQRTIDALKTFQEVKKAKKDKGRMVRRIGICRKM